MSCKLVKSLVLGRTKHYLVRSLSGTGRVVELSPERWCKTQWPGNFYARFPEGGEVMRGFSLNYLPPVTSVGFMKVKSDLA